jgi:hypothetical protein
MAALLGLVLCAVTQASAASVYVRYYDAKHKEFGTLGPADPTQRVQGWYNNPYYSNTEIYKTVWVGPYRMGWAEWDGVTPPPESVLPSTPGAFNKPSQHLATCIDQNNLIPADHTWGAETVGVYDAVFGSTYQSKLWAGVTDLTVREARMKKLLHVNNQWANPDVDAGWEEQWRRLHATIWDIAQGNYDGATAAEWNGRYETETAAWFAAGGGWSAQQLRAQDTSGNWYSVATALLAPPPVVQGMENSQDFLALVPHDSHFDDTPEPATLALLALGAGPLLLKRRRKQQGV